MAQSDKIQSANEVRDRREVVVRGGAVEDNFVIAGVIRCYGLSDGMRHLHGTRQHNIQHGQAKKEEVQQIRGGSSRRGPAQYLS